MTKTLRRVLWVGAAMLVGVALLGPFGVVAQVSGPIYAPDGSRTQPSYNFARNPRTGMFLQEKDNLAFVADGQVIYHYTTTRLHLSNGIALRVGDNLYVQGALGVGTDNPTSVLHVIGAINATGTLGIQGAVGIGVSPTSTLHVVGSAAVAGVGSLHGLHVGGASFTGPTILNVHAINIANDGTTNGNAEILSGAVAPVLRITCNDTQGCTLRFHEAAALAGTVLLVVNLGPESILVADHATVGTRQHLASSGALTGTANSTLQLIYMTMHATGTAGWYELGRSVN